MIYISELKRVDGSTKKHPGRPSKKYLTTHPEFVEYYEAGHQNEYDYRTTFRIEKAKLIEVADYERHER